MVNTSPTITEPTVRELSTLLTFLRMQETALKAELVTLADRINAIEAALQVVQELSGTTEVSPHFPIVTEPPGRAIASELQGEVKASMVVPSAGWAQFLRGVKQIDALRAIASANDGVVRTADAKRIFLEAGLAKGAPKHVAPHIYHMLQAAEDFERVAPGTFQMTTTIADVPQDEDMSTGIEGQAYRGTMDDDTR